MTRFYSLPWIAVAGLSLFQGTASYAETVSFREAAKDIMVVALTALRDSDFTTALKHFEQAQAIIDAAPNAPETTENQQARMAIPYLIGKTKADGKLGDPCPSFAKARVEMNKLLAVFETSLRKDDFPLDSMMRDMDTAQAANRCTKRKKVAPTKTLTGRYALSGVMEVGSELRLSEDGRYEWYMSYGSVDQYSSGTWTVAGRDVVLTHSKPAVGTPLFKPRGMEAWNANAENQVLSEIHAKKIDAVFKLCPFLTEIDTANAAFAPPMVESMPTPSDPAPMPDPAVALKTAQRGEQETRTTYERAAAAALRPGKDADWRHGEARAARYEWESAMNALIEARHLADAPVTDLAQPSLPKMCLRPEETRAEDIPEAKWNRGVAVVVGDPELDMNFQNVDVTFHFADGTNIDRKTDRRGFAWAEKRAGHMLTAVSLNYRGAGRSDAKAERFTLANAAEGVLPIEIQSRQFTAPPFDEMRLPITGQNRLGGPDGRGTYGKR